MSEPTYTLPCTVVDHVLDVAKTAHARATASPFWAAIRNDPAMREAFVVIDQLDAEVRRAKQVKP